MSTISRAFAAALATISAAAIWSITEPAVAENAIRAVPTLSTGHSVDVERLAFSPDGRQLASGAHDKLAKIWDVETGRMLRSLAGPADVDLLRYSKDGRRLVGGKDTLSTWDPETGKSLWTLNPPADQASAMDFAITRDSKLIVLNQQLIRRYDLETAERRGGINPFADKGFLPEFSLAFHMALSPDEKLVALGYSKSLKRPLARVEIVSAASGVLIKTLDSHTDGINAVAFSPDSRLLASASGDKTIKIWDVASGQVIKTLSGNPNSIRDFAWSPDGKLIYSIAVVEKAIRVWDVASGSLLKKIETPIYWNAIALSPDGKTIATAAREINLWSAATGALVRKMQAGNDEQPYVTLYRAPNADQWIAHAGRVLQLWDGATGQLSRTLLPDADYRIVAPGPDSKGRWLHATIEKNKLTLWDAVSGRNASTLILAGFGGGDIKQISPDGRFLLSQSDKPKNFRLWDLASGRPLWSTQTPWEYVFSPNFSPDGRWLIASVHDYDKKEWALKIWDTSSGRLASTIPGERSVLPNDVTYSPNQKLAIAWDSGPMAGYDMTTNRKLWAADEKFDADKVAFAPDSETFVVGEGGAGGLTVWNARSGSLIRTLYGNSGRPEHFVFLQGGRQLVVGNKNGTTTIWNFQTGDLLATIGQRKDGEWITITPEGFFAASEKGASMMHIVRGYQTVVVDQVYQSLYRPDLVREKLAGDPRGLVRQAAARLDIDKVVGSGEAPDVRISLPGRALGSSGIDAMQVQAEAEIFDRGGGIGRVEWRVNGVTVGIDTPAAGAASPLLLTRNLALDVGNNAIEVTAYNGANLIASMPAKINLAAGVAAPAAAPSQAPTVPVAEARSRLFAIVAGVNEYADTRFKLSYAVSDATDIARGFRQAAGDLYQSTEVRLMTDGEVTRDKLDAAFAEIADKASASDVFVLYLAGHGKTVDGRYHFVPQDFMVDGEINEKNVIAAVKAKGIAQDQWQKWFAQVPARKSVIMFDTCDSGTLAGDETQQLEKGAANDRLAQATGRSILAASGGAEEALEGYRGHGLFTYGVLDAINQADGDRNGTIEVNELAAYVYAQVAELSQKVFKQSQVPQMKITANYPLAKQTRILLDEVTPIAEAKPTFQVSQATQLQIQPSAGGTVVRSLSANTKLTVLDSKNGWSLVAREGKPIGYVATADLAPVQ